MRRLWVGLLLGLLGVTTLVGGAIAALPTIVSYPDLAGPTVSSVDVYNNYLETNDMLVVVNYYLKHTSYPSQTIDTTYIGRFLSSGVELANAVLYPYYSNGYEHGVYAMYFPASAPPPVWGGSYTVQFIGSPSVQWLTVAAGSAMSAAVAYDAPAFTDDTVAANNATANDMTLLPAVPAVGDMYYLGGAYAFTKATINIGTAGAGVWTIVWEYYANSGGWTTISGLTDGTSSFTAAAGNRNVTFSLPSDWATTTVNALGPYYYIRARVSAYTSIATQPKGTQAWVNSGVVPPISSVVSMNWHSTASTASTSIVLGANVMSWASALSNYWSVALTAQTATGAKLSSYGDQYFTNAIPNLRAACPQIYVASTIVYQPIVPVTPPLTSTDPWPWSTSTTTIWRMMAFLLVVMLVIYFVGVRAGRIDLGMVVTLIAIPIGWQIGVIPVGTAIVLGMLCVFALGFVLIIQRGAA